MSLQEEVSAQGSGAGKRGGGGRVTLVALWAVGLSTLLAGLVTFALSACRAVR